MPLIGTGGHGFPENIVIGVYRDEIKKFSASTSSQCSLKDIRIVIFSAKRPRTTQPSTPTTSASNLRPVDHSLINTMAYLQRPRTYPG